MGLLIKGLFLIFFILMGERGFTKEMDIQSKKVLDEVNAMDLPSMEALSPKEARKLLEEFVWHSPIKLKAIENIEIPGPKGYIPARVYIPNGKGPFAILLYFHGGGWVFGSLDLYDPVCRALADKAGVVVVAVDYRLAPEHKFPEPLEDCFTSLKWAESHIDKFEGNGKRIIVAGDSAGGNLAASVCLLSRDRKGPIPVFQILMYPVTDFNFSTQTYNNFAKGYFVSKAEMEYFWEQYLNNPEEGENPYASPLKAKNLASLPPAMIVLAEYDLLFDEGRQYAEKLQAAGVPVVLKTYPTIHGFIGMYNQIDMGRQALDDISSQLKEFLKSNK